MRPQRAVFAKEYISETVDSYKNSVGHITSYSMVENELRWAHDVLELYFSKTGNDPVLIAARECFESCRPISNEGELRVPYARDLSSSPGVSFEDFRQLSEVRRSVRWFLDTTVEREKIDRAIQVAAQSPSACNRQPFVFRVFDDPTLVKSVASAPMGTDGYVDNIPVFVVIVGQLRNLFDERDRHLIYIDGSLAAMSFIFAAETQGLSTCCVNWPDIEEKETEMADLLGLAPDERPVMCLAVGYPDPTGMVAYSQKKSLDQLRVFNRP